MYKREYLEALGEQVHMGEPLQCPICSTGGIVQPLDSFGNDRTALFCPHCNAYIELKMDEVPNG